MKRFQFEGKKNRDYFEGWYIRLQDTDNHVNQVIIFAMTTYLDDPHAFIQIYDGTQLTNTYYRFDITLFQTINDEIWIDQNVLSPNKLYLHLDQLSIDVTFTETTPIQTHVGFNSAMSYLSVFPLECFQEVLYLDGGYKGNIQLNNKTLSTNGRLYMEKTYGSKFPSKWIWIQSNQSKQHSLISFSMGKIPVLFFRPTGFFCILYINGKHYRFATYNGSFVSYKRQSGHLIITIRKRCYKLVIEVEDINPVTLVGPSKHGMMDLDVFESVNSSATVSLYRFGKIIATDSFEKVGFENMI